MKVSREWLQTYFSETLPSAEELAKALTMHAFEVEEVLKVEEDYVLEVKVLPNRAHDCLSHRGIAKELSVILSWPLKSDPLREAPPIFPPSALLSTRADSTKVLRLSALVVEGVRVGPSPEWLVRRLEALGQRSINNVVDVTNYVMLSLGQPLHAFDLSAFEFSGEGKVILAVREAKAGESLETLDEAGRSIPQGALLIADGISGAPLSVAGIKGGQSSQITKATSRIVLEAATFEPERIRQTSKFLRLRTDASVRFENGLSPDLPPFALKAAAELIKGLAGGEVEGGAEHYRRSKRPYLVGVSAREVNGLLGTSLSAEDVAGVFGRFGFSYERVVPLVNILARAEGLLGARYRYGASVKYDAPEEFDCSGFILFLLTGAGIGIPRVVADQYFFTKRVERGELKAGDLIFSRGSEREARIETLSFMSGSKLPEGVNHVGLYLGEGLVVHASGSRKQVLKEELSSSPDFKNIVGYGRLYENLKEERLVVKIPFERLDLRAREDLIEEVGRIYGLENIPSTVSAHTAEGVEINKNVYYTEALRRALVEIGFSEVYTYAFSEAGERELANPLASDKSFLRAALSPGLGGALTLNLANAPLLGLEEIRIFEIGKIFSADGERLSLGIGALAAGKSQKNSGEFLELASASVERALGVKVSWSKTSGVWECDLGAIISNLPAPSAYMPLVPTSVSRYKHISPYPFVLRDISLFVSTPTSASEVGVVIGSAGGPLLARLTCFDVFKKEDKTSYTFRLVFQSPERTLTDGEVNGFMDKVSAALKEKGWQVR